MTTIGEHMVRFHVEGNVRVLKIARIDKAWPEEWFVDAAAEAFGVCGVTGPAYGITKNDYHTTTWYW